MKPSRFYQLLFVFSIAITGISAQNAVNETVIISGTRFTYPLIEKWIAEYAKINPGLTIKLAKTTETSDASDLSIIAHQPATDELKEGQAVVYTGRYGLLPVTNSKNPVLATNKKGLSKKDIDKLFFEVANYDEEPVVEKPKFRATIYARDNKASASTTLAQYFGHVSSEIRGKKVLGDDIYLLSAISKDSVGITFNNLGYLFDLQSRKLKEGIALLPLDLKKDAKNIALGNLDEVISILEKTRVESIPVEKIGFIYSQRDTRKEVADFLKWVLADGQQFNHGKGFLNLDKQELAEQTNHLTEKYLSLK